MHRWLIPLLVAITGVLAACTTPPPVNPGMPAGADSAAEAQCNVPPDPGATPPCPPGCHFDNGACAPDRGTPVHNLTKPASAPTR